MLPPAAFLGREEGTDVAMGWAGGDGFWTVVGGTGTVSGAAVPERDGVEVD